MLIADLLSLERIILETSISSKKRSLELLSEYLAKSIPALTDTEIFERLITRERLGSTGLGHGVAIPHTRTNGVDNAIGAILKLQNGVDYDAIDQQPVYFLFALLVPENSTEQHLALLSQLAEMFSDERILKRLQEAQTAERILTIFVEEAPSHAA
jgi:PTS system nitrogen regulatory IIA component